MLLRAEGIAKTYFRKCGESNYFYAVSKTDFCADAGSVTVIMGRSGSGKSTLLNMLAGILSPSEGRILINGEDICKMSDKELSIFRNGNIGVIPQIQSALGNLTVYENVMLPAHMYGNGLGAEEYAEEIIGTLGLPRLMDVSASELSGGEARRTAIARALVMRPRVILADEPTSDLDDENTEKVFEVLKRVASDGAAVIIVTHENDAVKYADAVCRMNSGRLEREEL